MFYADTTTFGRHPNYASIKEKYETTKPWRGTDERPAGGRRQRWARLIKDGEKYTVTAWGQPLLTYRPDGFIDVYLRANHSASMQRVLSRMVPWITPWGCGSTWLMVHLHSLDGYPYINTWYGGAGKTMLVAVNPDTNRVSMREFTPNTPMSVDTLFETADHDLVGIPMFAANRETRNAAYADYGLPTFGTWARAYLQMATPSPSSTHYNYSSKWSLAHGMPAKNARLMMLRDPAQWPALVGDTNKTYNPVQRAAQLVEVLREDIQRELGLTALHVTHYQSMPLSVARIAHKQRNRTRHMVGWGDLPTVSYADALPQPIVATATNTTTPTEATT